MGSWSGPVTGEDSNEVDEVEVEVVEVVVALADLRAWLVCMALASAWLGIAILWAALDREEWPCHKVWH